MGENPPYPRYDYTTGDGDFQWLLPSSKSITWKGCCLKTGGIEDIKALGREVRIYLFLRGRE